MKLKFRTVEYRPGVVRLLDQTRLPAECVDLDCRSIDDLVDAIRRLVVRGAPAIGVAAAHGVTLAADLILNEEPDIGVSALAEGTRVTGIDPLRAARPTAVNLGWALDRMAAALASGKAQSGGALREALVQEAAAIHGEDERLCEAMGRHGADLLPPGATVLTHCNTGALATAGIGTALGVIYTAHRQGKGISVFADETRPLLQGARLTAWELTQHEIPVTLLCDGAAGWMMAQGRVDAVLVGSDRIAANGDVANKIGTYTVAALASRHRVPFYVVAPYSTLDLNVATGADIPIEERPAQEVTRWGGVVTAPDGAAAANPAFDVTPAELVTAIVTERGVFRPPYQPAFAEAYATRG